MTGQASVANPFQDESGAATTIFGVSIYSGSPRLAELACRIGLKVVWIEMEHGPADFTQAEAMCYAARAYGGVPLIRLPDATRNYVLKAVEVGAQIVVVPMVNDAATAREIVKHAKFPPLGSRGMNGNTPGTHFGLEGIPAILGQINSFVHLFAQIETCQAVDNLEAICQVEGLDGVFIGPTDLSVDMGIPGQYENPKLLETVAQVTRTACNSGKRAGILVPPGKLFDTALDAGAQLIIAGGDVSNLKVAWSELMKTCSNRSRPSS